DGAARCELMDGVLDAHQIVADADRRVELDLIVFAHSEERGLAAALAEKIDQRRRFRLYVRDVGIGDEHAVGRALEMHQDTLADFDQDRRRAGADERGSGGRRRDRRQEHAGERHGEEHAKGEADHLMPLFNLVPRTTSIAPPWPPPPGGWSSFVASLSKV